MNRHGRRRKRSVTLWSETYLLVSQSELVFVAGRDDSSGADHIDSDVAAFEIHRPRAGERPQRRLGCGVNAEGRIALD
jgi:hypothetical protein